MRQYKLLKEIKNADITVAPGALSYSGDNRNFYFGNSTGNEEGAKTIRVTREEIDRYIDYFERVDKDLIVEVVEVDGGLDIKLREVPEGVKSEELKMWLKRALSD